MDNQIINDRIERALNVLFPNGVGRTSPAQVRHQLETVATISLAEGRSQALMGLMTSQDVAEHFDITQRRARALIENRHRRFGSGMLVGREWLVHRDELSALAPEARYRKTREAK